jgi:hypothetical protein
MMAITDTGGGMLGGPSVVSGTLGHSGTLLPTQGGVVDVFDVPPACLQAP